MDFELFPGFDVSRETHERLVGLVALLKKWNGAINLISKASVDSAWDRHVLDSAQIFQGQTFRHWVDLGSGGGFPGLVVAVLAKQFEPDARVTLVEVDQRKATFLRQAIRTLDLPAEVLAERAEVLPPLNADVVSARALARLVDLCGLANRHLATDGVAVFLKGAGWRNEVDEAREAWTFDLEVIPSRTDAAAVVLKVRVIENV